MSSSLLFDLASTKLWADISQELSFPAKRPLLAHYTAIQTFEQIVSNREIWFSNPLFMNDLEELKFGMNEGAAEFYRNEALRKACGSSDRHELLVSHFESLYNDFDSKHVLNTYLLCFSEHQPEDNDGLLSMWRGYGNSGAGAAIVIDTEKFTVNAGSPLIVGKVHYGTKAERLAWINQKIIMLAEIVAAHAKTDADLFNIALAWFHRLKSFALFSKHVGFHEEREWRVVYMSDRDPHQILRKHFGHLTTSKGIEPKLKLPVKSIDGISTVEVSIDEIIDRIILGPSIASILGVNALKQMLRNIGRNALAEKVVASEIPFRPTN